MRIAVPHRASLLLFALIFILLAGCGDDLPSANNPTCSWATDPPSNATALCNTTFSTVSRVMSATARGDAAAVHRLVVSRAVANRVIAYGRALRSKGNATVVHVVPSLVLNITDQGLGALIYLRGKVGSDNVKDEETVYLRVNGNRAVITADTPGQDW